MREASTGMLEQGPQAPASAPGLILAKTEPRTNTGFGAADGGLSPKLPPTRVNPFAEASRQAGIPLHVRASSESRARRHPAPPVLDMDSSTP